MGTGGSKKKKEDDNNNANKEKPKTNGKLENTPSTSALNGSTESTGKKEEPSAGKGDDEDVHDSWNDRVLFSSDNESKVTKDDFELLTVIGKGSFGKVKSHSHVNSIRL